MMLILFDYVCVILCLLLKDIDVPAYKPRLYHEALQRVEKKSEVIL